jgi:translation initiation factor IF-1
MVDEEHPRENPEAEPSSAEGGEQENLRYAGEVTEALPNFKFRVTLETGEEVLAYVSGRLRVHRIRVLPGDKVTVEMSPYDKKQGRIVYRGK